jgi:dihydrofolate reductase
VKRVSLIVAMTRSGLIGRGGTLPWRLPADLARFKSLTMGHHLLMGRKTFESLGRVLPGRTTVVITRQPSYQPPPGVLVAASLDEALQLASADAEPFIIGGGEIFELALPRADRLYVTWVEADIPGDTFFPPWRPDDWTLRESSCVAADDRNAQPTTFAIYDRPDPSMVERTAPNASNS